MSEVNAEVIRSLPYDDQRGTAGMWLFITTEAMLFVFLFFAYYFLGSDAPRWPPHEPPKLHYALPMLGVLLASSAVVYYGERVHKKGKPRLARLAVAGTLALGAVFMMLQVLEYREHLRTLKPTTDAYGSIFYTITSFHAAHLVLGWLMLLFVLPMPELEPKDHLPHRPLHNAALYWHFVDLIWVFVVALLYVAPNLGGAR